LYAGTINTRRNISGRRSRNALVSFREKPKKARTHDLILFILKKF